MMATSENPALNERAEAVSRALDEAQKHPQYRHYTIAANTLPLLLHKHGLGQTLAYLQIRSDNRPNSPYMLLFEHLKRRLAQLYPITADNILDHLTQVDSVQYRRLAEEARDFTIALRRAPAEEAAGEA